MTMKKKIKDEAVVEIGSYNENDWVHGGTIEYQGKTWNVWQGVVQRAAKLDHSRPLQWVETITLTATRTLSKLEVSDRGVK